MNPVVEESLSPLDLRITISNKNSIFVVEIEAMERTLLLLAIAKVLLLRLPASAACSVCRKTSSSVYYIKFLYKLLNYTKIFALH